jgi:hypothetical protein
LCGISVGDITDTTEAFRQGSRKSSPSWTTAESLSQSYQSCCYYSSFSRQTFLYYRVTRNIQITSNNCLNSIYYLSYSYFSSQRALLVVTRSPGQILSLELLRVC